MTSETDWDVIRGLRKENEQLRIRVNEWINQSPQPFEKTSPAWEKVEMLEVENERLGRLLMECDNERINAKDDHERLGAVMKYASAELRHSFRQIPLDRSRAERAIRLLEDVAMEHGLE